MQDGSDAKGPTPEAVAHRTEHELPTGEAGFRALFMDHPQPMWVYAADDLRFIEVNDCAVDRYGYTREEFLAMKITHIRPEEEVPRLLQSLAAKRKGEEMPREWRHRLKDGTLIDVEILSHPIGFLGRSAVLVVVQDITERKRAAEALRESEEKHRAILEGIDEGYYEVDLKGSFLFFNDAFCRTLGRLRADLLGRNHRDITDDDNAQKIYAAFATVYRTGLPLHSAAFEIVRTDGTRRYVETSVSLVRGPEGRSIGYRGVVHDVTERHRAEAALRESEERYRRLVELSPDAIAIHSEGKVVFVNSAAARLVGAPRPEYMVGRDAIEAVHPEDRPKVVARLRSLAAGNPVPFVEERFVRLDGSVVDVEVGAVPFTYHDKPAVQVVVRDISERKRSEKLQKALYRITELTSSVQDMQAFYQSIHAIVGELMSARNFYLALVDEETGVIAFQYFVDEADVDAPAIVTPGKSLTEYVLRTGEPLLASPSVHHDLEQRGEIELMGAASLDWLGVPLKRAGHAFGVLVVQSYTESVRYTEVDRDILTFVSQHVATAIDRKQAAAALRESEARFRTLAETARNLAYHDALTGLPNRLLFNDRLQVAVAQATRSGQRMAVMFLDLDRFKVINDSLGHSLGDRLLEGVSARLGESVREGDTVARLGGDEFILLLPGIARAEDAAKVAEKIRDSLRLPFRVEDKELFVTASIGISLYPEDGLEADSLVKNADTAMYRAKEQGRDNYQLYTHAMNETAIERLALESSLRRALPQGQLVLHYQPLLDLATGRVHGVEALLRWMHPERGVVPPSEFIYLAEVTSLIIPMGPWVLRTACAQARVWQQQGHPDLCVAVNLSARQFQQPDLVTQVRRALDETGLAASSLDLEITESHAMQNAEATIATLRELKALGVRISIDDFGIGYSSLSYLKRLPIDTLKIDQSFVRDITTDPDDAAIATAVIALAHTLKLQVVAEGVETQEQLAFLTARHCDRMQGYLFSRPLPADECTEFLARTPRPA